jgi:ATP-binding cassette subfamily B multidrug efflux pump
MHGGFQRLAELADMAPAADRRNTARRLMAYLTERRGPLAWALLFVFLGTAGQALGPLVLQRVTNQLVDATSATASLDQRLGELRMSMVMLLGVYVLGLAGFMVQVYLIGTLGQEVLGRMRQQIFDQVQRLSMRFFDRHEAGDVMSRLVNDTDVIGNFLTQGAMQSVGALLGLVMILVVMFVSNWRLALLTCLVIPPMVLLTQFISSRARDRYRVARETVGEVSANLQEDLSGIREAQAFSRTDRNLERFSRANAANRDANVSATAVSSAFSPAAELLSAVATAIVLGAGGYLVVRGQATVGTITAFVLWVGNFFRPIQQLSAVYTQAQAALAGAERVFSLLDEPVELTDAPDAIVLDQIQGVVRFEDVTFGYDAERPVLQGLTLDIAAGTTVALVGETGAGKTTVASLLQRFYDVQAGAVLVDGHDVRAVTARSLRRQMGVVPQEPFLFSGSVAGNIRYGRPDATDEELRAAAVAVGADEIITALPQGYDTELGERGGGLSIGQRQLIALARAALVDPRILILDEATANIDTRTERILQAGLERLLHGRTSLVIAHRLSTIRHADKVVVLERGRVIESGDHDTLLAKGGRYAELYRRQFGDAADAPA